MTSRILVTGGAGYIGSHVVRQLEEAGRSVIVLDNLSTGFKAAVPHSPLVVGDVGDRGLVSHLLSEYHIDAVIHFASHTVVPDSVSNPLKYYANNTCSTHSLLECCLTAGIKRFIFSSTAAVYGIPREPFASEETPTMPINPYGTSKLMSEWMLHDLGVASGLRYVILRYFNVAGCDAKGRLGQSTRNATLLMKLACEAAVGKRPFVAIFGTDYPTPDGTGVRDYIHVEDLADAHLKALNYLEVDGASTILNCGYGHGYSVREVLDAVQHISGRKLCIREERRRPGDPPMLVAVANRIREVLGWTPQFNDLGMIVKTSLAWEQHRLY